MEIFCSFFLIVTNTRLQRCLRILKQFMTNALQSLMHIKVVIYFISFPYITSGTHPALWTRSLFWWRLSSGLFHFGCDGGETCIAAQLLHSSRIIHRSQDDVLRSRNHPEEIRWKRSNLQTGKDLITELLNFQKCYLFIKNNHLYTFLSHWDSIFCSSAAHLNGELKYRLTESSCGTFWWVFWSRDAFHVSRSWSKKTPLCLSACKVFLLPTNSSCSGNRACTRRRWATLCRLVRQHPPVGRASVSI